MFSGRLSKCQEHFKRKYYSRKYFKISERFFFRTHFKLYYFLIKELVTEVKHIGLVSMFIFINLIMKDWKRPDISITSKQLTSSSYTQILISLCPCMSLHPQKTVKTAWDLSISTDKSVVSDTVMVLCIPFSNHLEL